MKIQTQQCRCFIVPDETEVFTQRGNGPRQKKVTWRDVMHPEIIAALHPWAHPSLVFDTETLIAAHSGQQVKIVAWQERGLRYADRCTLFAEGLLTVEAMDALRRVDGRPRVGIAYNERTCTDEEKKTIKADAERHGYICITTDQFINILYRQSKLNNSIPEPKLIIGHNLPFDIGALSNRTVKSSDPKFYGALSLGLCRCFEKPKTEQITGGEDTEEEFNLCGYHPNIRIKKLGLGKHMFECGTIYDGKYEKGKRKYADACLEFLDTRTLARALLGPGDMRLEALGEMLKVEHPKIANVKHGEIIDEKYLKYARNDVQCTWEVFVKLRELYKKHNLKKRITHIYSEASIGKAY